MASGEQPPAVFVRDFGPFRQAEVKLRPLTILVGRNSLGKSMLAQLAWALTSATPDFNTFAEEIGRRGALSLAEELLKAVESRVGPEPYLKRIVEIGVDALPVSLASALQQHLPKVFLTELKDLVRSEATESLIEVKGPRASIRFSISGSGCPRSARSPTSSS